MRVLALVPGSVDDHVLFLPTLKQIHLTAPRADISVVAETEAKDFYRLSKLVSEVIPYSFSTANSPADWANLLGLIRDREFEAVISPLRSWSSGLLLWLSGIPTRIGYAGGSGSLFFTRTVPLNWQKPLREQYYDLLQGFDIVGACPPVNLSVPESELAWAEGARQQAGLGKQGFVLAYPGPATGFNGKAPELYPVESWAIILKDFQKRQPTLPLVLMQTPESAEMALTLAQIIPGVKLLAPENMAQGAALIAGANLVLSTDSYPLYLALALDVFAIGLFGGNDPTRQLPSEAGKDARVVGIVAESGRLADIAPETVLKKVWNE